MQCAKKSGLDGKELNKALADGRYLPRLEKTTREAHRNGINGAPTFVIDNKYNIVGAQPLEVFRDALRRIPAGSV